MLAQLGTAARSKRDWALAVECATQQLNLDTHFGEPPAKIAGDQETLIDLSISAETIDDAKAWLKKLSDNKGVNASDLSRYQQELLRECIRVGRLGEATTALQELWKQTDSNASALYRAELDLIEALRKSGKDAEAKTEIARLFDNHSRWIPDLRSFNDSIPLSKLAIDSGQHSWVPELLTKGETLMSTEQACLNLSQFAELWRKLGNEKHADELMYPSGRTPSRSYGKVGNNSDALNRAPWQIAEQHLRSELAARFKNPDIADFKAEYEKSKSEDPYSAKTQTKLARLQGLAMSKRDWALAIDCALSQLDMDHHLGEPLAKIAGDQKLLIDLCISAGRVDDAKTWLKKLSGNKASIL